MRLVRGTGGGPLLQKGGRGFLRRGGGVLKKPVEVLKEFDPLPSTLSVSPQLFLTPPDGSSSSGVGLCYWVWQ